VPSPPSPRDEFAESLARSQRRRAHRSRNPPHPALLPQRERRRAFAVSVLVVLAFFALVVFAAIVATHVPIGGQP
jgi:ABC-type Fe3+ transport system permease subunit